jgi:hypothetical protein
MGERIHKIVLKIFFRAIFVIGCIIAFAIVTGVFWIIPQGWRYVLLSVETVLAGFCGIAVGLGLLISGDERVYWFLIIIVSIAVAFFGILSFSTGWY